MYFNIKEGKMMKMKELLRNKRNHLPLYLIFVFILSSYINGVINSDSKNIEEKI